MEKVYAVWSGEYEDRVVHNIFKSKELAEHYAEEQEKINEYECFWVQEYELYDEKFTLDDVANKYYYASVWCTRNGDNIDLEIETDELWDDFVANYAVDSLISEDEDKYDPAVYGKFIEGLGLTIEDEEKNYALTIEYRLDNRMLITEDYNYIEGKVFTAYSRLGYHDARKAAVELAQKYMQEEKCNGKN